MHSTPETERPKNDEAEFFLIFNVCIESFGSKLSTVMIETF